MPWGCVPVIARQRVQVFKPLIDDRFSTDEVVSRDDRRLKAVLDNATVANLYTGLGSSLYSAKQFDQAAAALTPQSRGRAVLPATRRRRRA